MSSIRISAGPELSSANATQSLLRIREIALPDQIKSLREITLSLLSELESLGSLTAPPPETSLNLDDEVRRFEIALIRTALIKTKGNQAGAARLLGVKHTTLNAKIKRYQLQTNRNVGGGIPDTEQEMAA
jgi:transcriptional regulator with GAF, ATPase, and Fis domain